MVSALLIVGNIAYKVNHTKISESIRRSFSYTGERWPVRIDKVNRKLQYSDDLGAIFELTFPDDPNNPLIWDLLDCEDLKVYHNTNKTRFQTPPGRNNYYVRLVFSHPKFLKCVQLLFRYNIEMTPISLNKGFFDGKETIMMENQRM